VTTYDEALKRVLFEGSIIACSTGGSLYGTVHAGRVSLAYDFVPGAFSMFPLCRLYRKLNGEPLAKHERYGTPQLTRPFTRFFADVRDDRAPHGPLCPHCVAVFDAEQAGIPLDVYQRLSRAAAVALRPALHTEGASS